MLEVHLPDVEPKAFTVHAADGRTLEASVLMPVDSGESEFASSAAISNEWWMLELGLMRRGDDVHYGVRTGNFENLAGQVCRRDEESAEDVELLTHFISLLFLLDDMLDDAVSPVGVSPESSAAVVALLEAGVHGIKPEQVLARKILPIPALQIPMVLGMARGWADLTERLRARDCDLTHYIAAMSEYLHGVVDEANVRAGSRTHTCDSYEELRIKISAVYPALELHAALRGSIVPLSIRNNATFVKLRRICNLTVSFVNDFFSYRKESLVGESNNLIMILAREQGLTEEDSLLASVQLHDDYIEEFFACKESLEQQASLDSGATDYLHLMERWMRGNFDWCCGKTDRYIEGSSTTIRLVE